MRESNAVKILKFQNKTKASELAKQLLSEAQTNEPKITKSLQAIAKLNQAEMVGLNDKFKSEMSLARKLSDDAQRAEDSSIENQAKQIDDVLRYTMIFSEGDYENGYQSVLSELQGKGFDIRKVWNAWAMEDTPEDTGYRGINATIISSQNQQFELQFHTEKSFRVKTETHNLYEERRNPQISEKRFVELKKIGTENAKKITRPRGI